MCYVFLIFYNIVNYIRNILRVFYIARKYIKVFFVRKSYLPKLVFLATSLPEGLEMTTPRPSSSGLGVPFAREPNPDPRQAPQSWPKRDFNDLFDFAVFL